MVRAATTWEQALAEKREWCRRLDERFPFYKSVPKTPTENLKYRIALRAAALKDTGLQSDLRQMCADDLLFFVNTFCWVYEPRPRKAGDKPQILPFLTYFYQDRAFYELLVSCGVEDVGLEKSRDLGISWVCLTFIFHQWMFVPQFTAGIMSRQKDLTDKTGSKDTLFWKIDQQYLGMPAWLQPRRNRIDLMMENYENGSTIEGAATTGDPFRAGRKTIIFLDEFAGFDKGADYESMAATQAVSDNRVFNSTPRGAKGQFYEIMTTDSSMKKIVIDWRQHPGRCRGMYQYRNGQLHIFDRSYRFPPDYPFIKDEKVRSPYYDKEERRPGATPQLMAQEYDRNYEGSDFQYFSPIQIENLIKETARNPVVTGELAFDPETLEGRFAPGEAGRLLLWRPVGAKGSLPWGRYVVGADISHGLGGSHGSNSVAEIFDATTSEQVGEFAVGDVRPEQFAMWCIACCKWLGDAFLIWEGNGAPGSDFTNTVIQWRYLNIYFRQVKEQFGNKSTKKPGWWSRPGDKSELLGGVNGGGFRAAIYGRKLILRSEKLLTECGQFIVENGRVIHSRSLKSNDPTEAGEAHGDRVIAAALAGLGISVRPAPKSDNDRAAEPGSLAHRRAERRLRDLTYEGRLAWNQGVLS